MGSHSALIPSTPDDIIAKNAIITYIKSSRRHSPETPAGPHTESPDMAEVELYL